MPGLQSKEPEAPPDQTTTPADQSTAPAVAEEVQKLSLDLHPGRRPIYLDRLFSSLTQSLQWGGYIRNESAFRVIRPSAFDKVLNILQLQGRYQINSVLSLTGRVRAYWDAAYDFEAIDSINPIKGPTTVLTQNLTPQQIANLSVTNLGQVDTNRLLYGIQMKELFLDANFKSADFRLGRQIVKWGVVEGSRVTDVINPLDFAELIMRDIDDRYIPLFMLRSDLYVQNSTYELLIIPEVKGNLPAPPNSEWEQFRFLPNTAFPQNAWANFPNHLGNAEIAFKYSHVFSWAEISLSYFYTWDPFPTSFRLVTQSGFGTETDINFNPAYTRLRIYGATFTKSIQGVILNAEMTYTNGKDFGTHFGGFNDLSIGALERDFLSYAIGLDRSFYGVESSVEFIEQVIFNYSSQIIQPQYDTIAALFLRREFLHNLVGAQLLAIYFQSERGWMIIPRAYYNVTDRVRIGLSADVFEGSITNGTIGEFNFAGFFVNNTRVQFDVTYSF